jgi:hypothetical protein
MINRDNKHRQAHHKEVFFQWIIMVNILVRKTCMLVA